MTEYNGTFTQIVDAIKIKNKTRLRELFDELHPYDQAQIIMELSIEERKELSQFFSNEEMAEIIQELDNEQQLQLIDELGIVRSSQIIVEMSSDDAADLLGELDEEKKEKLFHLLDDQEVADMRELLEYSEHSAGGIMTTEYIVIPGYYSAEETVSKLRQIAPDAETVYYLYVVDEDEKLSGVLSLRDLIIATPETKISDIMSERVVSVPVDMDQEEVAKIMEKYDFLAVPVVDKVNRLVGIITIDDVMDVVKEETTEDFTRMAAIRSTGDSNDLSLNSWGAATKRLPWLVILLFVGLMSGNIIAHFEGTLDKVVALAFFMPMIAGMAGNTGTQSLAVVVRGLALGQIEKSDIPKLLTREAGVGLVVGAVNGILIAFIAMVWQGPVLGFVIGISLFATLVVSTLAGAVVPLILNKLKIDPAVASGPFITTINDVISLTIYFTIATMFMSYLLK